MIETKTDWRKLYEQHENVKAEKYVVYLRRSLVQRKRKYGENEEEGRAERTESLSIEQQWDACQYIAKQRGLEIVEKPFQEQIPAKEPNLRPAFDTMMQYLKEHPNHGVLSWAPDRLTRNALEAGELIQGFLDQDIVDFQFVTYHFHQDSSGLEHLLIEFARAMGYSLQHRKNVMRGMLPRYSEGKEWLFPEKFGYKYLLRKLPNGRMRNTKFLIPHEGDGERPGEFQALELAFDLRTKGRKLREIVEAVNDPDNGFITKRKRPVKFSKQKLSEYLNDTFYYGVMEVSDWGPKDLRQHFEYDDDDNKVPFVPVVLEEEFEMCKEVNKRELRVKTKKHDYVPFRGLLKCGNCGEKLHPHAKKDIYFYCMNAKCTGRRPHAQFKNKMAKNGISADALFKIVTNILKKGMNMTKEDLTYYLVYLEQQNQLKQHMVATDLKSTAAKSGYIENEMKKAGREFQQTFPYVKGEAARKRMLAQHEQQMKEMEERWKQENVKALKIKRANLAWTQKLSEWLERSKKSYWYWKKASPVKKRDIAALIFLELTITDGKLASYRCDREFAALEKLNLSLDGGR